MENQLKPYDKYILYVFIAQVLIGLASWWVDSVASLTWLAYAFYIFAVIKDTDQIAKAGKVPPSKWWILILPVYLWKRANVLATSKQAFWGVIAAFVASVVLNILIVTAGVAYAIDVLEEAEAAEAAQAAQSAE